MTFITAYALGVFGVTALAVIIGVGHVIRECSLGSRDWRGCLSRLLG
jgi:hypothetical protein